LVDHHFSKNVNTLVVKSALPIVRWPWHLLSASGSGLRFGFRSVDLGLDGLSIVLTALAALWQPSRPSARPLSQWTTNSARGTVHDKGALDYEWRDVSLLFSLLFCLLF
jgi:hypothetical protein